MEFLLDWWGVIVFAVVLLVSFIFMDRKIAKEMAWQFIYEVEANARHYGLEFIWQKKMWVKNWYPYLPPSVKLFVSEALWVKIVDGIYAQLPTHTEG